ncbi:hypothetical protein MD537_23390, partial [Flavihumibacter sediminis]|nr:hypothetical protein [Flavihumibacter sediminis]
MKKALLLPLCLLALTGLHAQEIAKKEDEKLGIYRETPAKINNLVHTKLDARFDYNNAWLNGKVWITLQPHFYPTDSLT